MGRITILIGVLLLGLGLLVMRSSSQVIDWMDTHDGTAAWVQAVGSVAAIASAFWLHAWGLDREKKGAERARVAAVRAIATNCISTLRTLDNKARGGTFSPDRMAYYEDEAAADLASVATIQIAEFSDARLIDEVVALRRVMATARRRVGFVRQQLSQHRPTPADYFKAQLEQGENTLIRLRAL